MATIEVVDDELLIRSSIRGHLESAGYEVCEAENGRQAVSTFERTRPDLVLLDYKLPDLDGISVLKQIKKIDPDVLVIMMTSFSTVEHAVEAMRLGAHHYLDKLVNLEEMGRMVQSSLETTRLRREVKALRANLGGANSPESIIGRSPPMVALKSLLMRIAQSPSTTVLVTGESGTGKDRVAKAIHFASARATGPLVNITCSAIPDTLLESELFGHEKGSFTDAHVQKKGLIEQANGGTIFLDEIGEMSPVLQAKLLRFLEEKAFRRVGGTSDIRSDVRVIAATNRDLQEDVVRGKFREDLFYRLNVLWVKVPPLRDRGDDIEILAKHFMEMFGREFRKIVLEIDSAALAAMRDYPWTGNVRELKNAMERAVLLAQGERLTLADFPQIATPARVGQCFELPPNGVNLDKIERDFIEQALRRTQGNQTKAAALLGMNRDQIRYRIKQYGLRAELR